MPPPLSIARRLASTALFLAVCASCTDEKIVFREPVNPPPDANSGFLGYFTTSSKQTTCGNCHVGHQAAWEKTAHASAYAALISSGGAQTFCYGCHTVSDKGNATAGPAGWDAVPDTAYHDVQCENCHGPGYTHVQQPDAPAGPGNPPLAHVAVLGAGTVSDTIARAQSCGDCHSGVHSPYVEEWEQSGHAKSLQEPPGTYVASNAACASCHEGKAVLAAWGVTSNYVEKTQTDAGHFIGATCAVCHDPHGSARDASGTPIEGQLRFRIDVPDVNQNLCMKCHQRRPQPDQASSRGPHSPQGPMLLGDAGYQPAGFQADTEAIETTHGSVNNPRLCAGCHVNRYTVTDPLTGSFTFQSVGHLFRPIPCLDVDGKPTADNSCPYTTTARTWGACTKSGCHANAGAARSAFDDSRTTLDFLIKEIWDDKNGNDVIDTAPTDGGLLSNTTAIPKSGVDNQYVTNDGKITPAEGAAFNVRMLREGGADKSFGVHNPFMARALLLADIDELEATYTGLPVIISARLQSIRSRVGSLSVNRHLARPSASPPIPAR
jgi:hypothetical protein